MVDRTFRQHGIGIGAVPTEITAKIDGVVVFSGSVLTDDVILPPFPNDLFNVENVAFSWTGDTQFQGTLDMEITVLSGHLLLANTEANNPLINIDFFGRPDLTIAEGENVPYCYPYVTDITINGQAWPAVSATPWSTGQGWFNLPASSVYSAKIHVIASTEPIVVEAPDDAEPQ
jgi:hypothetical protein